MNEHPWPAGLKRTRQRELIWRILLDADKPLDARDIYRQMDGSFAASTVYRALAAFEEAGVVTKTTMMGEETALYSLRRAEHEHYAICLKCHRQVPLKHCPFEDVPVQTEAEGFTVTNHKLELYGYCRDCQKRK